MLANAGRIKQWGSALSNDADLLLYGCDVAKSDAGRALVDALSRLTGADVAASEDATGNTALGGDWNLEYYTGEIATPIVLGLQEQTQWMGLLARPRLRWHIPRPLRQGSPQRAHGDDQHHLRRITRSRIHAPRYGGGRAAPPQATVGEGNNELGLCRS